MNREIIKEIENINYKETQHFIPQFKYGKVIKVYDGDTFTIGSIMNIQYPEIDNQVTITNKYRFNVRMSGIDTPEIKSKNDNEKKLAIQCKEVLTNLIYNKIVELDNIGIEKYGRILADVYIYPRENNKKSINNIMLEKTCAKIYNGGKKNCDWN